MVRVRMSARLYPPRGGIMQTTGVRVGHPPLWARMSGEFHKNWKLVVQEVEWPSRALKQKEIEQYVFCWGYCVGLWEVKRDKK